jgi:hypothetical protein
MVHHVKCFWQGHLSTQSHTWLLLAACMHAILHSAPSATPSTYTPARTHTTARTHRHTNTTHTHSHTSTHTGTHTPTHKHTHTHSHTRPSTGLDSSNHGGDTVEKSLGLRSAQSAFEGDLSRSNPSLVIDGASEIVDNASLPLF